MRLTLWAMGLLLSVAACAADVGQYEARVRARTDPNFLDMVQARSEGDARIVLRQRYPECAIISLRRLQLRQAGYDWYLLRASVAGVNIIDTALAVGSGQARRIFSARFPGSCIVSLTKLRTTDRYLLYASSIHSRDRKVFEDVAYADGASNARKALQTRYPGCRISSIAELE